MKSGEMMSFPQNFQWGAATASYQIEGAYDVDGKGLSVWDAFCRKEGAIWNGESGDVACDHYHRFKEDVRLMAQIGLKAYRFSISWPRVLPVGVEKINPAGLDFYDKLVDELLAAGIQPFATLFHWDFPLDRYKRGGWLNPASPDWFADYTRVIVDRLGDRLTHWITLNEPSVFTILGHQEGRHAPGLKLSFADILQIAHHALLAHGKAVQAIRSSSKLPSKVGMAPSTQGSIPWDPTDLKDIEAARNFSFTIQHRMLWQMSWWMDPVFFGEYPAEGLALFEKDLPDISPEDMATINQPVDFFGFNMYTGNYIRMDEDGSMKFEHYHDPNDTLTAMEWPICPDALYWATKFLWERYQKPIYITENGMANCDWVALDGQVHDPQRIDFTHRYLLALKRAIDEGADVKGYFYWSLLDNFEWGFGYKRRFGLVYVDFVTQQRILKDSAYWYREVIRSNGVNL
jgi:beta-glucosidase